MKSASKFFLILNFLFFNSINLNAASNTNQRQVNFVKGEGSKFKLKFNDSIETELSMYMTYVSESRVDIEFNFLSTGLKKINMFQQFSLEKEGETKFNLSKGYFYVPELKNPEILSKEYFHVNDGVEFTDFIFNSEEELNSIAKSNSEEEVSIPAGIVMAKKYERIKGKQKITFWISKEARPIGLVKLISTGESAEHNYQIELTSLIKNVSAQIDPDKATPLSDLGKSFLPTPKK